MTEQTSSAQEASEPPATPAPDERAADQYRTELRSYREHLWRLRETAQVQADNLILALSGVLLTLSISFVTDLVPLSRAICVWALVGSWVILALAIGVVLISHLLGRAAIDERLGAVNNAIEDANASEVDEKSGLSKWTHSLNWTSAALLMVGVLLTMLFVITNVLMEDATMPKPMKKSVPVKEGVTPPPAPKPPGHVAPAPAPKKPVSAPPTAPPPPGTPKK